MNDRRQIFGWTMYDWANSAFSTTVVTTFLGPYLIALANNTGGVVNILGFPVQGAAFFPACVSISVIMQVLFLPILGTIADYTDKKKSMMMAFAYAGALATILLFTVNTGTIVLGGLLFILANLCFGAAIVFYNSFLPEITTPDKRDAVSSRGFALGYLGGGVLLALNLVMVNFMADTGLAVRLSLASAGIWWLLFTILFPQRLLPQSVPAVALPAGQTYLSQGVRQILQTFREMRAKYPVTLRYLLAYLIYNDGIQTVIVVSTQYASEELKADATTLTLLVLLIQFVAFGGAFLFGALAQRLGAKRSIIISLIIWSAIVIYAYAALDQIWELYPLGVLIAIVLGGSQALSRSLYSQMIPLNQEGEYFGFYEISERGTSWLGPLLFGLAVQLTGTQRVALVSLVIFFVVGLLLLLPVNVRKGIIDAGHDPTGVIIGENRPV